MPKNKKKKASKSKKNNIAKRKKVINKKNLKATNKIKKLKEKNIKNEDKKNIIKDEPKEAKGIDLINVKEEINKEKEEPKVVNKKNYKTLIIRIICILILIILIGVIIFPKQKVEDIKFNVININEYIDLYKKDSLEYIFIIDKDCKNCDVAKNNLQKLKNDFSIEINELNIHDLTKDDIIKLQNSNSSLKDNIDVPILLSIKNGNEIGKISAIKEYSALKKFVNYSSNPIEINSFNKININKYLSLLKSNEMVVIYIGNSTNSECRNFSTILESVSQELEFKVNYLDTDNITKSDDWKKLNTSNKIFEDNWFMPAILIVKKGNIVGYKMESMDKETLLNFFDRYGL